jgi:hypothetical protein
MTSAAEAGLALDSVSKRAQRSSAQTPVRWAQVVRPQLTGATINYCSFRETDLPGPATPSEC